MKNIHCIFGVLIFSVLCFGSASGQGCTALELFANSCDNESEEVTFTNTSDNNVLFKVAYGSPPLLDLGQYQFSYAPMEFVQNWESGTTMFFVFSGRDLITTQNLKLLESSYQALGNNEVVLYGLDDLNFPLGSTQLTFFTQDDGFPGTILANTSGYPKEPETGQFTTFNDVVQIPQNQIFSIRWSGGGSNECQAYGYSFTITY